MTAPGTIKMESVPTGKPAPKTPAVPSFKTQELTQAEMEFGLKPNAPRGTTQANALAAAIAEEVVQPPGTEEGEEPEGPPEGEEPETEDAEDTGAEEAEGEATEEAEEGTEETPEITAETPWTEVIAQTPTEERTEMLTALLESPEADQLMTSIPFDGRDVEMSLAEVKRYASGYLGQEKVRQMADTVYGERENVKQLAQIVEARRAEFAKHLDDPRALFTYLEQNAEDAFGYLSGLAREVKAWEESVAADPAGYRAVAQSRASNRQMATLIKELKDALTARGEPAKPPTEDLSEARRIANEIGQRRERLVVSMGYKKEAVLQAWNAAGRPEDFEGWFGKYTRKTVADSGKKQEDLHKRAGPALRRKQGGGTGARTPVAPSGGWPERKDLIAALEGTQKG